MQESSQARVVDLNADLGEEVTDDHGLLQVVTSANIACGYHAGTPAIMRQVCAEAAIRGVSVGAQVSYADRENFGRVPRDVPADELAEQVADQVGLLATIAATEGVVVGYLKPHGALYHRVIDDEVQAAAVLLGSGDLPVLGFPGGELLKMSIASGRKGFTEAFPDRGYGGDGRLLPRSAPGAIVDDAAQVALNAVRRAAGVDSVCVHGDTPGAVANAWAVRVALEAAGWTLHGL